MTKVVKIARSEIHDQTGSFLGSIISRPWRGFGTSLFAEVGPLTTTYARTGNSKADQGFDFGYSWRVESSRSILFGSDSSERRIEHGVKSLEGLIIEDILLLGRLPELVVKLSKGLWIYSFSTSSPQPGWTIFLPDSSWLTVRRGTVVREHGNQQKSNKRMQATGVPPVPDP